jgi:dipeptide/tripeptide permease
VADNVLFALRVARTTYLKKIALDPSDITPTISLGVTIDHSVAMTLPILSGWLWEHYGHQWVFLLAGALALAGFFVCLRIRIPLAGTELPAPSPALTGPAGGGGGGSA